MMDHQTCSGLLAPFVRDELSDTARAEVEAHLGACEDCRLEESGLRALLAPLPEQELRELERARLHREVWATVEPMPQKKTWGARLGPYLGTAAALLLVAAGITYGALSTSGGNDSDEATSGSVEDSSLGGGDTANTYDAEEDQVRSTDQAALEAGGGADGGAQSDTAASGSAAGYVASPVFDGAGGSYAREQLEDLGRSGYPFTVYRSNYSASDARQMQDGFLDQLAAQAGGAESRVRACGRTVLDKTPSEGSGASLPAWAALGGYGGAPNTVIVGVAFGSERLDLYFFWVFDENDCSEPIEVIEGQIED